MEDAGPAEDRRQPVQARAKWAYSPRTQDELAFGENDVLTIFPPQSREQYPPGWVLAGLNDQRGLVPSNHIRLLPREPAAAQALEAAFEQGQPAKD